ncbi:MAG: amidohydrolase [Deltaproteobacteria bacterium]|nr:amidohydrolase [Deltaproteobacteria bacterium]
MLKIDCHVHLIGHSTASGGYISPRMKRSIQFKYLIRKQGLHRLNDARMQDANYAENLAIDLRTSEIDKCILLALDQTYSAEGDALPEQTWMYIPNDYVRDVAKRYEDCFLYGASVHPFRPDSIEELERVYEDGAKLVKLLPNSQGFDPSDSRIKRYYQKAADLGLPLLFHCGFEHTIPAINQQFGEPNHLIDALEMGVKVIIAHGGTSGRFHRRETFGDTLRLLAKYDNCYADNSAMTNFWRSQYMPALFSPDVLAQKYGVDAGNPTSKFLHGSDYPIPITPFSLMSQVPRDLRKKIRCISNPFDLDLALKRAIGFDDQCFLNTVQFLRINSE